MITGLSESPATDAMLAQAVAQYRSGRIAEAERLYRQVLTLRPNMSGAHAGLAIMLYLQGRPQDAIAAFRRAVEIEPASADLLYKLGNMLMREGAASDTRVAESFACFARHARLT